MRLCSGIIPIAADTKRLCIAWRSKAVRQGDCWGIIGGECKSGISLKKGALLELKEEVGYSDSIKLHTAWTYKKKNFLYQTFVGIVPQEFGFFPGEEFAWETDFIEWVTLDQINFMIKDHPKTFHKGMLEVFKRSKDLLKQHTQ